MCARGPACRPAPDPRPPHQPGPGGPGPIVGVGQAVLVARERRRPRWLPGGGDHWTGAERCPRAGKSQVGGADGHACRGREQPRRGARPGPQVRQQVCFKRASGCCGRAVAVGGGGGGGGRLPRVRVPRKPRPVVPVPGLPQPLQVHCPWSCLHGNKERSQGRQPCALEEGKPESVSVVRGRRGRRGVRADGEEVAGAWGVG